VPICVYLLILNSSFFILHLLLKFPSAGEVMRQFFIALIALCVAAPCPAVEPRPNVVVILADDMD
jgi:hypothetical protein